jgi:superfamily I DNA/RNA helicase
MLARFGGKCARCGSAYAAGQEVWWDKVSRKILMCPACEGRGKPEATARTSIDVIRASSKALTAQLTQEQRDAVTGSMAGVNRWLATAGSGKTRSLIALVGELLSRGMRPGRIVVTSFTKKAAGELTERLTTAFGTAAGELELGTLHSLVRKWLLQHAKIDGAYNRVDNLLDYGGGAAGAGEEERPDEEFDEARPRSPLQLGRTLLGGRKTLIPWLNGERALGEEEQGRGVVTDHIEAVGYMQAWLVEPGSPKAEAFAKHRGMPLLPRFYELWSQSLLALSVSTHDEWIYLAGKLAQNPKGLFIERRAASCDVVIVDEAQDNNLAQLVLAANIALNGSGNLVLVGDIAQCQPAGTKVLTPTGERDIEQLQDGDLVCAWDRRGKRVEKAGRPVKVASRPYTGRLTTVSAGGKQTRTTSNHRWLVRWSEAARDAHVVYLMRRTLPGIGLCYRLGWCKLINESGGMMQNHLKARARLEKADAAWILKVTTSRQEASVWESIYSTRYQIPLVMFEPRDNQHYTRDALDRIWAEVSEDSCRYIDRLMIEHRLDPNQPFYKPGGKTGRQTLFEVRAEHLLDGLMQVPVKVGAYDYEWHDASVTRGWVTNLPVYSMDVERHGSYVADGICTLNSMFGFRGALPLFMWKLEQYLGKVPVKTWNLSANFRSTAPIVEVANKLLKGREWNIAAPAHAARPDARDLHPVHTVIPHRYVSEAEQAREIVAHAKRVLEKAPADVSARPMVVIGRAHARLAQIEASFIRKKLPYLVQEGRGFFNIWEVRVASAYLLLANDVVVTAKLIKDALSAPRRRLGKVFASSLLEKAQTEGFAHRAKLLARRNANWEKDGLEFARDLDAILRGLDPRGEPLKDSCGDLAAQGRALVALLTTAKAFGEGASERFDNIRALVDIIIELGSIEEYAKFYKQATTPQKVDDEDKRAKVVLSTAHAAKGLEWDEVWVVAMNQGVWPHDKSTDDEELEEEARIEYVAVTRAKNKLHLSRYQLNAREQKTFPSRAWIHAVELVAKTGVSVDREWIADALDGRAKFQRDANARAELRRRLAEEARARAAAEKQEQPPEAGSGSAPTGVDAAETTPHSPVEEG